MIRSVMRSIITIIGHPRGIAVVNAAMLLWFAGGCESRHAITATRQAQPMPQRIPVILDTDIGDDIDDTWALVMLLKSPQFDVKLITTTNGKQDYRVSLLAKLLMIAG